MPKMNVDLCFSMHIYLANVTFSRQKVGYISKQFMYL